MADLLTPPLAPLLLAFSLCVVFAAGMVRGFAGFGFSAVTVAGMSLVVSPAMVVPALFMLEILASLSQLRSVARDIDMPWFKWLALGTLLATPLGLVLLAWLPETQLRLLIGFLLLMAALLLRSGRHAALTPTAPMKFAAGLASGFITGVAAIGGIALAVLLSATRMAPAALRATLIALILFSDVVALAGAALIPSSASATGHLFGSGTLKWVLWLAPAMLAGIAVGQRSFSGVSQKKFRSHVLNLLIVLAALSLGRSLYALLG
ncbi:MULTISPECIES: sulfite exporter TauE/SafE family protein [unclassified Polaromonas]|uniref:sulfite exporter TauE/SafE family protein n=1 Tax=unclassified Polaromonas TaxID=2638319 RepID=UPI0018CA9D95|nr:MULTISPECIES: sulfite exporter TauE/SafE family protein [unclassified Polaromonas]MBG6072420.1 putative membrane protein YfcA [Polaromonas sp. CG_9.7]MBG6114424.1 putative membrane protein YfcA [Polaromonas sp. CG_9.2]MDH6185378.1 putative membrane protein YfcA [Polaromonas sp. CG_23.6]